MAFRELEPPIASPREGGRDVDVAQAFLPVLHRQECPCLQQRHAGRRILAQTRRQHTTGAPGAHNRKIQ